MLSTFWAFADAENMNKKNNKDNFKENVCKKIEKFMPRLHLFNSFMHFMHFCYSNLTIKQFSFVN